MKLGSASGGWPALLDSIGASPARWEHATRSRGQIPAWHIELQSIGLDVQLDDITIDRSTGLYLYKGQQVLIYIKYTYKTAEELRTSKQTAPRFHFLDCKTFERMKEANRFQRYVAIARTDGLFPVESQELDRTRVPLETPLGPCRNCLEARNYKRYADEKKESRNRIWESFAIPDFFAAYSTQISAIPLDSCDALDPKAYASDWEDHSHRVRADAGWRCSECRLDLSTRKQLLHAHHVDRDKTNNWRWNLRPLCCLCHHAQPGHDKMYVSVEARSAINTLRAQQGLAHA